MCPFEMVIFHSYIKLPEGKMYGLHMDLQSSIMATRGFSDRFGCHEFFFVVVLSMHFRVLYCILHPPVFG